MGVGDKLRKVGNYVRKRWRSTGADSYDHYKRGRERERKQAEQRRGRDERHGEQEREEAERGRESRGVNLKGAIGLSARPRSRARRHLEGTRANPNDGSSPAYTDFSDHYASKANTACTRRTRRTTAGARRQRRWPSITTSRSGTARI